MTVTFKSRARSARRPWDRCSRTTAYGAAIPVIYGMTQSNLLAIWAANLRQGGGNTKKFKQIKKGITNYCENIDFLLGHNPIRGVIQVQDNGTNFPVAFTSQSFSGSGGRQTLTVTDAHFYFVIAVTLRPVTASASMTTVGQARKPSPAHGRFLSGTNSKQDRTQPRHRHIGTGRCVIAGSRAWALPSRSTQSLFRRERSRSTTRN